MNEEGKAILTIEDLRRAFVSCGVSRGQHIIVHASMSRIGFVAGGAEAIVRALLDLIGDEGTLLAPAQTWKNLDPSTGVHGEIPHSWWPIIREHWPAFDPLVTPSVGMGAVAETIRIWPGAKRSGHPARSFAAIGRYASYLTEEHDLRNIFGAGSPLDRLYQLDGYVLLIGVGHEKNTSLHLAETKASFPGKHDVEEHSAMFVDGKRAWVSYHTQAVDDHDFIRLGTEYEQEHAVPIHAVGGAEVRLIRQRPLVDWTVAWMERHRT
ncbi:aminoglycoside N(3)-acetyltransferase [Paenibacillus nanensis]|uniref:Aminoglycoside N(3)-acetyltransferase n=1 Tax=Paenibacillus nanensis TaxID=393251 RepID=A0A3A1UWZ5_9BACL|nr:AAC(3) family N-acetyltransferase [Paenibacillus nanensis]RIX51712.1 aminoglycoside N(3)-acetyltransferase [Paenibacillus nanensis]